MKYLLIDKPIGWTSFDAVAYIRKMIRTHKPDLKKVKVGHAGTLDPFASGLLIIGVGREATKHLDDFKKLPKTYIGTVYLGATSDTLDSTGTIGPTNSTHKPTREEIQKILEKLTGPQEQIPPMFSAKKIDGQRLYKLAREGKTVERKPVQIEIFSLKLLKYEYPEIEIEVKCSAGTYIRSLAGSIGEELGTGAYCSRLTRTAIGDNFLKNARNPEKVDFSAIFPEG